MSFGLPPQQQRVVSLRCSHDDINWPDHPDFRKCPLCERKTWVVDDPADFDIQAAYTYVKQEYDRRKLHEEFEAYYQKREAQRAREAERRGLTDDDLAELLK